ncbi:MAG: hypothetical protein AAF502_10370 [Bacteroidota bacterium]
MLKRTNSPLVTIFGIFLIIALIFSCRDKNKNIPDVSDVEIDIKVERFEQDLFTLDTNDITAGIAAVNTKYPEFGPIYFNNLLGASDVRIAPEGPDAFIRGFITDQRIRKLYDTCQVVYNDFSELEAEFEQSMRFYKHYFPEKPTPQLLTFISEYFIGALIYGDDKLAVGLDFFLGSDYPYQDINPGNPNFSDYIIKAFNKDHLVSKTLQVLIDDIVGPPSGQRLLDFMVHNGKKKYILEQLIPYAPDSVVFEHSGAQMNWLKDNELDMWAFFVSEDYLYSTRQKDIRKYIEPSPDSPGMPTGAPGNTATFMGYKIVEAYMNSQSGLRLQDLVAKRDAQAILTESRYKPRRN